MAGEATVTEAMLTGESEPARKFSIASRDPNDALRLPADKQHVLFGGTRVVSTARGDASEDECVAVVLRTGFATSQGELTRTILFAGERSPPATARVGDVPPGAPRVRGRGGVDGARRRTRGPDA